MGKTPDDKPAEDLDSDEKKLCVNCMTGNDPDDHFCIKCGAPMTSYAAIGPVESLFAEGHVYRQAAEKPRKLIVVVGVWFIFGFLGLAGIALIWLGRETRSLGSMLFGAFILPISLLMIWNTTRNYMN